MQLATLGVALAPGWGVIGWLVVGAIAGALAGTVMSGSDYGLIGDIVVGIVGALIGGWILSLLGVGGTGGFWFTLLTAFIGACILIAILRMFSARRPSTL